MPRYHFSVHDGHGTMDLDGSIPSNQAGAKIAAVELAGQMLAEGAAAFWRSDEWRMDVTDDKGLILFILCFTATLAPASGGIR